MRTLGYCPYNYGREYIEYSLKSVIDHVDEFLILYSGQPSYGQSGLIKNPEKYSDLIEITDQFPKVTVKSIPTVNGENKHRGMATEYANSKGYDLLFAVDADEVWNPETVEKAKKTAYDGGKKRYGVNHQGWFHFWRSFNEVNKDGFEPIRWTNLNVRNNNDQGTTSGMVYHFGYANSVELQRYKMSIHGHKGEIKNTWFDQKWLNYEKGVTKQLHPASNDIWIETQYFDKYSLPEFMKDHPYFNLDRII